MQTGHPQGASESDAAGLSPSFCRRITCSPGYMFQVCLNRHTTLNTVQTVTVACNTTDSCFQQARHSFHYLGFLLLKIQLSLVTKQLERALENSVVLDKELPY